MVWEAVGRVVEYPGGYEDWLRQRPQAEDAPAPACNTGVTRGVQKDTSQNAAQKRARKLSYTEQLGFEQLPARIEALESQQEQLQTVITDPLFYTQPATEITRILARLEELDALLLECYERWSAFDSSGTF